MWRVRVSIHKLRNTERKGVRSCQHYVEVPDARLLSRGETEGPYDFDLI